MQGSDNRLRDSAWSLAPVFAMDNKVSPGNAASRIPPGSRYSSTTVINYSLTRLINQHSAVVFIF